jgi:uncharacterized protein (DUF305 family)
MRNARFNAIAACALAGALVLAANAALADAPGTGRTAHFEIDFLKSIIDHHFAAVRMSELATGTDATRDPAVPSPTDGVASTPGFAATPAKAMMDELKSMARRENRMQREEIMTAQRMLKEWYGLMHEPMLTPGGRRQIALLEGTRPGAAFDHLFMETMSRHHYAAVTMATDCLVASDIKHDGLQRYCSGIQHGQINDINEMREMLCKQMQICDYQPLRGIKGRHSGERGEAGSADD